MFFQPTREDKLEQTQKKLRELSINMEKLDREYQKLLDLVDLKPEEIESYIENSSNFPPDRWERIQNEKKKLDEKLNLAINQVTDPRKVKKALSERGSVQPNWLFVR